MKQDKTSRCPGCGHHCPLSAPKCKFGRQYQQKIEVKASKNDAGAKSCKWEAYVVKDGLAWNLLMQAKSMKKSLKAKKSTEQQIFQALSDPEQEIMLSLLRKLQP